LSRELSVAFAALRIFVGMMELATNHAFMICVIASQFIVLWLGIVKAPMCSDFCRNYPHTSVTFTSQQLSVT
jgi:hypothetical protein